MKRKYGLFPSWLLICLGLAIIRPVFGGLPIGPGQLPSTLAPILKGVTPAVVNIATAGRIKLPRNPLLDDPFFRRFFDFGDIPRERRTQSLGSGVIVDAQRGYVITNHHVIEHAQIIAVTLQDGRQLNARLIGSDPESDVAVIQIPAENLTALALADSDDLEVGDFVVAIGNPFGLGQTVTSGIVSALGRSGLGIQRHEDFIQTDASINPGNSGGALVNLRGQLVGINTAILAPSGGNVGIGFAIPSNRVKRVIDQLLRRGRVSRGKLGMTVQDLNPNLARAFGPDRNGGAVITQVASDSQASAAGLKPGDVVAAANGKPVYSANDLRNAVGFLPAGERIGLDILRAGTRLTVSLHLSAADLSPTP